MRKLLDPETQKLFDNYAYEPYGCGQQILPDPSKAKLATKAKQKSRNEGIDEKIKDPNESVDVRRPDRDPNAIENKLNALQQS